MGFRALAMLPVHVVFILCISIPIVVASGCIGSRDFILDQSSAADVVGPISRIVSCPMLVNRIV